MPQLANRCAAIESSERTGRHDSRPGCCRHNHVDIDLEFVAGQTQTLNEARSVPRNAARRHHRRMTHGVHSIGKNRWIQPPYFCWPYRTHCGSRPQRTGWATPSCSLVWPPTASLQHSWNAAIEDGLTGWNLQRGARGEGGEGAAHGGGALPLVRPWNNI